MWTPLSPSPGVGVGLGRRVLFLAEICLHWSQKYRIKGLQENTHLKT